jgi:hypothetical protein
LFPIGDELFLGHLCMDRSELKSVVQVSLHKLLFESDF